jgi:signal transduction histidine kinase
MIIEDVELDPSFAPHRQIAAAAGYRAVQSTPLKSHDGRVVGMLSTHFPAPHRVTESDQQQLDLYARHAADVIIRVQYEQALRDGERRKDEFLATLAHELRNPLAPIRHGLGILKRDRSDPDRAARVLPVMERQVSHMVRLIDDLLDVGRIASNKLELKKERVELASIVHEVVDACRPLIENAGHELSVKLPSEPINLRADPVRLSQVLGNLITNSCKYTEPGGRIWLTVERQASEAAVSVRDNGAGIPRDQLPNVFNLFMQVDRTLERSNGGLGLGLPLVKRLVEMHGGSVTAHSDGLGRGSEFIVRLRVLTDD